MTRARNFLVSGVCAMLLLRQESAAVIFDSTGDPTFNTAAPTGALAGSGWQYEGLWGGFLGTAIAPQYFVTAKHVGGSVGQSFLFGGSSYLTIGMFDSPGSDLRIWQVDHAFSIYAPLYTSHDEVGKNLVVIGRGTQRGLDVTLGGTLKGWLWGGSDGVERWGENQVAGVVYGGPSLGLLLGATFDHAAGANEAHLSSGDSGGGVFIQDGSTWKLAGINYGVDGPFSASSSGSSPFLATLFDTGGYYEQDGSGAWVPVSGPSAFYSTLISTNAGWITSVIPEPGTWGALAGAGLAGLAAVDAFRRRRGKSK